MTGLQDVKISVADLIKALVIAAPCVMTIGGGIWYFSAWSQKVDMRLDDVDRDLRSIHLYLQHGPRPQVEDYTLPYIEPKEMRSQFPLKGR